MIEEFKRIGRLLFEEGLVHGGAGNLSVRQGNEIIITRKGTLLSNLGDDHLVTVGMDPGEADKEASVELPTHRAIYKACGAQAIVHAHPSYGIALSMNEEKIIPQDAEGKYYFKSIPVVRVREPIGSDELSRLIGPVFQGGYVVALVRSHGSFAIGTDLKAAYLLTASLENSCKIITLSRRPTAPQPQPQRPQHQQRPGHGGGRAIPPGIGVMDRERYRKR